MNGLLSLFVSFSMHAIDGSSELDIRLEVSRNLTPAACMAIIANRPSPELLGFRGWEKQNMQFDLWCGQPHGWSPYGQWLRQAPRANSPKSSDAASQ